MASKIEKIISLESKLENYAGEDRIITSHELRDILGEQKNVVSFATGVPTIDRVLQNTEAGELIVVSGPTGYGKTSLLVSITKNIAEKVKSVWFTLEVTPRQFISKFGDNLPLFYIPAKNTDNNIQWLIARIIEAKVKHNIQMVFIDHLHQLFSIDKFNGKNLSLELGDIVARLKQLAITYDLVIWLVSHSTDDKERINREPKMMDIRDSGMISRLADIVIGVWRIPNSYTGTETTLGEIGESDTRSKVRIWKNRRTGKLGYLVMEMVNGHLQEVGKYELDPKEKEFDELGDVENKIMNF
jgi:replicative DNA helicase